LTRISKTWNDQARAQDEARTKLGRPFSPSASYSVFNHLSHIELSYFYYFHCVSAPTFLFLGTGG
jgi:hypothetical protein